MAIAIDGIEYADGNNPKPSDLISSDAKNQLTLGTDNKLKVADNSVSLEEMEAGASGDGKYAQANDVSAINSNLTQKFTTIDCGKFNSSDTQTFAIGKSPKEYAIIGFVIDYGDNVNYEMYGYTDNILIIRLNIDGSLYIRKKQSATYNNYNLKVVLMKL